MSTPKKRRVPIPKEIAARVLFSTDRRCCVCRESGKQVQIHHIDDDPSNNDIRNLASLCFDCHSLTQIRGGFGRKLDADQVYLYRDSWVKFVAQQRQAGLRKSDVEAKNDLSNDLSVEIATSLAEIYRENDEPQVLASHYNTIGNLELRDKWIECALSREDVDDFAIIRLRAMQDRADLIPEDVAQRVLDDYERREDWAQRARILRDLHRYPEAVIDYVKSIAEDLERGRTFTAAYYLKELGKLELHKQLFLKAYSDGTDLWWKVRALQEVGWDDERKRLLLENEGEIRQQDNPLLIIELEQALGDTVAYVEARKDLAVRTRGRGEFIVIVAAKGNESDDVE
jgi:hypothetical protein